MHSKRNPSRGRLTKCRPKGEGFGANIRSAKRFLRFARFFVALCCAPQNDANQFKLHCFRTVQRPVPTKQAQTTPSQIKIRYPLFLLTKDAQKKKLSKRKRWYMGLCPKPRSLLKKRGQNFPSKASANKATNQNLKRRVTATREWRLPPARGG